MKKTLIYGAIGGVALYLYLQLQKKKKLSTKETSNTKQDDASGTSITSGTGGIKPPKINPLPFNPKLGDPSKRDDIKVPPMSVTTPNGEGDGVSVKNDAPTPPAPTVEPVYGGGKPTFKPLEIKEPKKYILIPEKPQPQPNPFIPKPVIKPTPIATDRPIVKQPMPIKPVVMPQPNPFIPKPVIKPTPIATDRPIEKLSMPIKPVVSEGIVDVKDFVIPRITAKRPTILIR